MLMIKDDQNLYLKCDFSLLADVFEKSRNNSFKNYGLFPSCYLSTPSLSCDAKLNMAIVDLELTSDPDMYRFFEKSMRCGVSYISNRYSKANNMYLKSDNPKQESKHITYLDMNNLYVYTIS